MRIKDVRQGLHTLLYTQELESGPRPDRATTSGAARLRRDHQAQQCENEFLPISNADYGNRSLCRCRHGVLLVWASQPPYAGGAGARPAHPIS